MRFFPMEIGRSKKPTDPFFMEISNLWSEFEIFWAEITKNSIFVKNWGPKSGQKHCFLTTCQIWNFILTQKSIDKILKANFLGISGVKILHPSTLKIAAKNWCQISIFDQK